MSINETRLRQIIRQEARRVLREAVHPRDRGTMWDPDAAAGTDGEYPEPGADDDDDDRDPVGDTDVGSSMAVQNLVHVFRQYYPDLARSWGGIERGGKLVRELAHRLRQIAEESTLEYTEDAIMAAAEELANRVSLSVMPTPRRRRSFY